MDEVTRWKIAKVEAKGWSLGNHKEKMGKGIIAL
jgi:hypothetical protein